MTGPADNEPASDPLRSRLRAVDPATGLDLPPDRWIAELTEAVMSTDTETPLEPARPQRRRWLVPAALVAASVAAVLLVAEPLLPSGDDQEPSASAPATPSSAPSSAVPSAAAPLVLRAGGAQAGRCMAVTSETLRRMPTAFEGVVLSIEGQDATLRVTRWWLGTPEQRARSTVVVRGMSPELTELVAGVQLAAGGRYLVTATGEGEVTACGFSAAWSPRLERLYAGAFGG